MPRAHAIQKRHVHAQALVEFLIGEDGVTTLTSREVATRLGMTDDQFGAARRHTQTCTLLGGYIVAYRGLHRPLGLIDSRNASSLLAVTQRGQAMMRGHLARKTQRDTEQTWMADQWEALADDAQALGEKVLARACRRASADVSATGSLSPKTERELRSAGLAV